MIIRSYTADTLKLAPKFWELVINKEKISTIRLGYIFFNKIRIQLVSGSKSISLKLLKLDYSKTFGTLTEEDAKNDGFNSLNELKKELKHFYPDIVENYPMTIIYFATGE